jgi:uncharacterized protein YkwD
LPAAQAGVLDAANAVRRAGCDQRPGISQPLRRSAALDRVARRWAEGGRLQAAEAAVGHHSRQSVSLKFVVNGDDAAVGAILRSNQCRALTNPEFSDAGLELRGTTAWLVLAAPYSVPADGDAPRVALEVLARVNRARSIARSCGSQSFGVAPPLRASALLARAAQTQARDMAQNDFLAHEGSDGSRPSQRAARVGYAWKAIGENVAGGPETAAEVVDGWLASPGHCRNIMDRNFTEMGVGFATEERSELLIYWSQVFGRPR